jgi:hypothetical protein
MKATIDFDPSLYRRLKLEAARRGRTVRELVAEGVRRVLSAPPPPGGGEGEEAPAAWFATLRGYAANAGGRHDLAAMRRSVARRRPGRP